MSGLATVDKGWAILGIVPPRRGLGAALAPSVLARLLTLLCHGSAHRESTDYLTRSDRQLRDSSMLGAQGR